MPQRLLTPALLASVLFGALGCSRNPEPTVAGPGAAVVPPPPNPGGTPGTTPPTKVDEPRDSTAIVAANNAFAFRLFARLGTPPRDENLAFSPYTISTALAVPFHGARGLTAQELTEVLGYTSPSERLLSNYQHLSQQLQQKAAPNQFVLGTSVWLRPNVIRPEFRTSLEKVGGEVYEFEPGANSGKAINDWVTKATKGAVTDVLPPGGVPPTTALLVTSVAHLKGAWDSPFNPNRTVAERFNGPVRDVAMMSQALPARAAVTEQATLVEFPLAGGEFVVDLILPPENTALQAFETKTLTATAYSSWIAQYKVRDVRLSVPRFRSDSRLDLAEPLAALGMPVPFSPQADFSGLSPNREGLAGVLQRTTVTFDETGLTASSATTAVVGPRGPNAPPDLEVTFDRPFAYVLRAKTTGVVLFVGRVVRPEPFK